jgi:hypothetical protein
MTYTASAALARVLEIEKCRSPPFCAPNVAGARLCAFKHKNLGLDAQLLNEPADTSTEAAARTALCALIVVGLIGGLFEDQDIFNFFLELNTLNSFGSRTSVT